MDGFSIEVSGQTVPLTRDTLIHTLSAATSRDPQQIQTGTKQLQAWEAKDGYLVLLQVRSDACVYDKRSAY